MIIYLDESGDLGFDFSKAGTTKTFVITLLVCNDREASQGFKFAIRRTMKNKVNRKKGIPSVKELKGSESPISVKSYFLRHTPDNGWSIYSVVLNKQQLFGNLKRKIDNKKLYNFLAHYILEELPLGNIANEDVLLVVDRSKRKKDMREFNEQITNNLEGVLPLNVQLYISHEYSHENPGIQAVDSFCWGIFKKYEAGDTEWYEQFSSYIAGEHLYPELDNKKDGP